MQTPERTNPKLGGDHLRNKHSRSPSPTTPGHARETILFDVVFVQNPMGLILSYRKELSVATISGFETLGASLGGELQIGDELVSANSLSLESIGGDAVLSVIKSSTWPIKLRIRRRLPRQCSTSPKIYEEDLQSGSRKISQLATFIDHAGDAVEIHTQRRRETISAARSCFNQLPKLQEILQQLGTDVTAALERLEHLERVAEGGLNSASPTEEHVGVLSQPDDG